MMTINLNLFVTLSKYLPENSDCFEISRGTTVEKLVTDLNIPKELVKLIFIDGKLKDLGYKLKQGERIGIFPPVGGG
jgi:molybdopterin synthase sulfur carrier subunit